MNLIDVIKIPVEHLQRFHPLPETGSSTGNNYTNSCFDLLYGLQKKFEDTSFPVIPPWYLQRSGFSGKSDKKYVIDFNNLKIPFGLTEQESLKMVFFREKAGLSSKTIYFTFMAITNSYRYCIKRSCKVGYRKEGIFKDLWGK